MLLKKIRRIYKNLQNHLGCRRIETDGLYCLKIRPVLYEELSLESFQQGIDDLQTALVERKLLTQKSGVFDAETRVAVEKFQARNHFRVDGIVGGLTWAALMYPKLSRTKVFSPETAEIVRELQLLLCREKIDVEHDGFFGRSTERAVKRFQRRYGLRSDGVCGAMTWLVLRGQRPARYVDSLWRQLWWKVPMIFEQLSIVAAVHVGIHFSPLSMQNDLSFFHTFVTAYGLTCVASPFLETFCIDYLEIRKFSVLRFSPYVLVGFLFRQILAWILVAMLK